MATAEARITLFSSVFMSATVCFTVDSKVASSMALTRSFACPRTTRPMRLKKSERNPIVYPPLPRETPDQIAGVNHVDQKEMHAREHIVLVVRPHVLQLAKIVKRHGHVAVADIVKLEVRGGDAIIRGKHAPHDVRRDRLLGGGDALEGEEHDIALQRGFNGHAAGDFTDAQRAFSGARSEE